jgi:hypothetical protein
MSEPTEKLPEYRVGQIWSDRKRRAEGVFFITHVYKRLYKDGNSAVRVVGLQSNKEPYQEDWLDPRPQGSPVPTLEDELRDLDARSMAKMYPHKMWEPYDPYPEEDK